MADQNLKIWALNTVLDGVKGNAQKRLIQAEEWLQGWGRLNGVTNQHLNSLFNMITHYAAPIDTCPYPYKDTAIIPDEALHMNGQTISQTDQPELFKVYGNTLTDMTADNLTGHIWIVRNH